jgi:type III restriction enzyme
MSNKQFQYEIQPYQEDCIENIISIFDALQQNQPFCEALTEHQVPRNYRFPVQDSKNIDIMMETGTGKTFTFIKTMFELNKKFGYKKFIILIPTVPIREGTKTNLEDTKEYFKQFYANEREKEIEVFVYESGQISSVKRFIETEHLSVLVMTPSSFDKDSNILNRPLEKEVYAPNLFIQNTEPPKSYLDCLKRLNPIVIMDEPHRFDGDAFKKYFEGFDNYYLRFGATFPPKKKNNNDTTIPLSNVAYTLDGISSFRQNLVKKIVVYTQDIVQNQDSLVRIEKEGSRNKAIVNTLSNGVIVRKILNVGDIYNGKSIRKINTNNIVLNDESIEKVDYNLSDDALRTMIKETIKIHFEKEKALFEQGIKALTLFFIESDTELYRGDNPKIKKIFEEEYIKQRIKIIEALSKMSNSAYLYYLQNDFDTNGNLRVNEGYFSGDKGNADEKIKAGVDEILRNKKKLLSFESPTRFIFSIWALQEGWDNPNVFTICKLSNQGSEISKLQQIGRGLRICVDQNLKRHTIREFDNNQDDFWKINNLDVVVSNQELGFVEAIQNEILSNSFFVSDTFTEQELKRLLKDKGNFDDVTVRKLSKLLDSEEMILFKQTVDGLDIYEKSPNFSAILKEQNLPVDQHKALESLFASDYKNFVQEKSKIRPKKNLVIKTQHLAEFQKLWNSINRNAFYMLENLDNESEKTLIDNIKTEIEMLNIDEILLQTIRKDLNVSKIGQNDAITEKLTDKVSYKSKVDYLQFVRDLSNNTKTPISFIVKIFNVLSSDFKNKILANNPAQALKEMTEIVSKNLVNTIKTKIRYNGIDGIVLPNVFLNESDETFLKAGSVGKYQKDIENDFSLREKWIFKDVIEYDSDFEIEIVEQDPDMNEIDFFGKMPQLKIKTPLGEYNPDFCYAVKSTAGNKLILIVESKGYETSTATSQKEEGKFEFAQKYFEHLNEYYKDRNIKISFKKRIKNIQLASLIKQTIEEGV